MAFKRWGAWRECNVDSIEDSFGWQATNMTSFPSASPGHSAANKSPRYLANWRARFFLDDRKIQFATVSAIYKGGYGLQCVQCLPIGSVMNLEFLVRYKEYPTRIRVYGLKDGWIIVC